MHPGSSINVEAPVPAQFHCPISLELMIDPVTLPTGQTFDRGSIQRWFRTGTRTCPATREELQTVELVPNLALKSHIWGWQVSHSVEAIAANAQLKIPSNPRLLTDQHVKRLLDGIRVGTDKLDSLKLLKIMAKTTEKNRRMIVDGGALPLLFAILSTPPSTYEVAAGPACDQSSSPSVAQFCEEALGVMAALSSNEDVRVAVGHTLLDLQGNVSILTRFLGTGTVTAKANTMALLECLAMDDAWLLQLATVDGLLRGIVSVLRDNSDLPPAAVTAGLRSLYAICLPRKNRPKAIQAGAVAGVLELLPGAQRTVLEGGMAILNLLARCCRGREELCDHPLSIPLIAGCIVSISDTVTDHAVKVLHSVLMFTANPLVHALAVKEGVFKHLLLVLQSSSQLVIKRRAQEVLKFLQIVSCVTDPLNFSTISYSMR